MTMLPEASAFYVDFDQHRKKKKKTAHPPLPPEITGYIRRSIQKGGGGVKKKQAGSKHTYPRRYKKQTSIKPSITIANGKSIDGLFSFVR